MKRFKHALTLVAGLALGSTAIADEIKPPLVVEAPTVKAELVGTMPFVPGPTFVPGVLGPNLGSPVPIHGRLYLIDQNEAIYRATFRGQSKGGSLINIKQVFNIDQAPDQLLLDNRQAIVNVSPGKKKSMYVVFTSGSEPTTPIPIYRMPDPLPGTCCNPDEPIPLDDLYRIGPTEFF